MKVLKYGVALAAFSMISGTAVAGSVGNSGSYSFQLFSQEFAEAQAGGGDDGAVGDSYGRTVRYYGSTTIVVPRFDPNLGTLTGADIEGDMNIRGTIFAPTGVTATGFAWGGLRLGPLEIDLDFSQYDGVAISDLIEINESDSGFDITVGSDNLSFFSQELVLLEIEASFEYRYDDASVIGSPQGFTASGGYDIVYTFDDVEDTTGGSHVVPTPSALAAGLLGLTALVARRRRRAVD